MERAYAPYSGFRVGAALRTRAGRTFVGCNVESASYGLSMCAERNAIATAVANGESDFTQIVIVASTGERTPPCGACRQLLAEFCDDLEIVLVGKRRLERTTLRELLPRAFRAGNLVPPPVTNYSKPRSRRTK